MKNNWNLNHLPAPAQKSFLTLYVLFCLLTPASCLKKNVLNGISSIRRSPSDVPESTAPPTAAGEKGLSSGDPQTQAILDKYLKSIDETADILQTEVAETAATAGDATGGNLDGEKNLLKSSLKNWVKNYEKQKAKEELKRSLVQKGLVEPKIFGCFHGIFLTNSGIDPALKVGVFESANKSYPVIVQFSADVPSNASDAAPSVKRLFLRFKDHNAPASTSAASEASLQDVLLENSSVSLFQNIEQYNGAIENENAEAQNSFPKAQQIKDREQTMQRRLPKNLWNENFWGLYPVSIQNKLGRFKMKPCVESSTSAVFSATELSALDQNYYEKNLSEGLSSRDFCFDFGILKNPQNATPADTSNLPNRLQGQSWEKQLAEDATLNWEEGRKPALETQWLGKLQIKAPTSANGIAKASCSALLFSEWNGSGKIRALGSVSRLRRFMLPLFGELRSKIAAASAAPTPTAAPEAGN